MNEEFKIKLSRIRELISVKKLDAIYLKRQDNFAWLTCGGINYVALGELGNCGLLVTMEKLYAITNTIEETRMRSEERLEELGFIIHAGLWHDDNFENTTLTKLVPSKKIGFDHNSIFGPNIAEDIKQLRFSLTTDEIKRYRIGGRLVNLAVEETAATIRPGDTELQVVARLHEIVRKYDIDIVSAMCSSDERIRLYRHAIPTLQPIKERVQLGGNFRYKGLIISCTRFVNFVPITQELYDQYEVNVEIDCILIQNTVPGKSYASVLRLAQEAYKARGYEREFNLHHQGGPIGYQARDYRVNFSHTGLIKENQAFCWNPSITGTKSEDTIIVSSNGVEFITYPIIFPVLSIDVNGKNYRRAAILEKII